jgi:hypothetical protein
MLGMKGVATVGRQPSILRPKNASAHPNQPDVIDVINPPTVRLGDQLSPVNSQLKSPRISSIKPSHPITPSRLMCLCFQTYRREHRLIELWSSYPSRSTSGSVARASFVQNLIWPMRIQVSCSSTACMNLSCPL